MGKRIFAVITLAICSLIIYAGALESPFQLDDQVSIVENKSIRSLSAALFKCLNGRPITNFSFALDYHFNALNAFGYHLTNLIIHILCSILVFLIIEATLNLPLLKERFGRYAGQISWLAGLIFAVHPLHSEAVVYLNARTETLASLFYLASLFFFILAFYHHKSKNILFSAAIISALLAMGAKEIAATIPILIFIYDFMLISEGNLKELKKRWPFYIFLFSTLIFSAYLIFTKSDYAEVIGFGIPAVSPINYLLTQFSVVLYYIKLIFLPHPLNLDYDWPYAKWLFEPRTFLSLLALIGILILIVKLFKRRPLYAFLILWYFLILAPSSSIIPLREVIFEYRVYLASVGIIWLALLGIFPCLCTENLVFNKLPLRYLCFGLICLIIPVFGWMSIQRSHTWQSEISLWEDTLSKSPNKARVQHNLGRAYQNRNMLHKAIQHYSQALKLDPYHVKAHYNLASVYIKQGRLDKTTFHLQKAVQINPEYSLAHNDLGAVYAQQGFLEKALFHFKKAIQIDPSLAQAHYNLAMTYETLGYLDEAKKHYQEAVRADPACIQAKLSLRRLKQSNR